MQAGSVLASPLWPQQLRQVLCPGLQPDRSWMALGVGVYSDFHREQRWPQHGTPRLPAWPCALCTRCVYSRELETP